MPNLPLLNNFRQPKSAARTSGFTLLELLTVMTIISLLAAMTYPIMGWVQDKQRIVRAKADIDALGLALDRYKVMNGTYPIFDPGSLDLSDFQDIDRKKSYNDEKRSGEALLLALTGWNDEGCKAINVTDYDQRTRFIELDEFSIWSDKGKAHVRNTKQNLTRPVDVYLADPWRQPYLYKYPVISTEGGGSSIPKYVRREDFILLSKGPDEAINSLEKVEYGSDSWLFDEDAGLDLSQAGDAPNLDNITSVATPTM